MLFAIRSYSQDGSIKQVQIYRNAALTDDELDTVIKSNPESYFEVLHRNTCVAVCHRLVEKVNSREIRPITLKQANIFVKQFHRHHNGTIGCKFAIGLYENNILKGVAICGRPVSRYLDNGEICEINRLCTLGDRNMCSQLYGACVRIAKEMGYKKIITYILESESGTSLKAAGFICEGKAGGIHWTGSRNRKTQVPAEMKMRWTKSLK